jgi:hypothetical protein
MPRSVLLTIFTAYAALHCAGRQVRSDLELEDAVRRAAAGEERGWQSLENTVRSRDDESDVEMQKRALAEVGKIQSPRGEPVLRENLTNRLLRGEAAAGLIHQRNDNNKAEIDATIVEAAAKNAQEFSGLTREEIKALGETENPGAVRLLKQQIGRDPNKDEATIEALGKILKRKSRSFYHPLNFTMPLGQAPAAIIESPPASAVPAGKLSVETIMSSEGKDQAAEQAPITEADKDPELVLLQYLAGDGASDVKDRAVQSIADAHRPGVPYLLALAAKRSIAVKSRIAIVDYLTRLAVNAQDKSMIHKFQTLRSRAGNAQLVASINLSLRVLGSAFGRAVAGGTRTYRTVTSDGYEPLPKETDIVSLAQRPYPGYSAADVKTNLKKALAYYKLDIKIADRMQGRVNDLLNQPQNKESPERNLIFSALGRLYPNRDFYVLKKQGQDAFAKPGYFTTTLRLVTASARGRSWQIAALQRLWGLTYNEADLIRQIYLRDGKLLQQRMRL